MQHEIDPLEALFLWRLASAGGGDWLKAVSPDPGAQPRKRLEGRGFIETEKRRRPDTGARASFVSLADAGWAWLGDHLDADLNARTFAGNGILRLLLGQLKAYLDREDLALGDFIRPADLEPPPPSSDDPKARVTAAYYELSGGESNVRVRLSDLRRVLAALPRTTVDAALVALATSGEASLFRLDNPAEIGPADREAVLRTSLGEERHVVFLGGRGV